MTKIVAKEKFENNLDVLSAIIAALVSVVAREKNVVLRSKQDLFLCAAISDVTAPGRESLSGGTTPEQTEKAREVLVDLGLWLGSPARILPLNFAIFIVCRELLKELDRGNRDLLEYTFGLSWQSGGFITRLSEATLWFCRRIRQRIKSSNPNGSIGITRPRFESDTTQVQDIQRPDKRRLLLDAFRLACRNAGVPARDAMIAVVANKKWGHRSHISKWLNGSHKQHATYDRLIPPVLRMSPQEFQTAYEKRIEGLKRLRTNT